MAAAAAVLAALLPAAADSGRELFESGSTAAGGRLSARAGADGSWVLRGAAVACANCHGVAATGGGEGYLRAPDLRWPQWSSPDPGQREAARNRLRRALRQGMASDGRALGQAMPRFDIDEASFEALAAHLQRLAAEPTPGPRPRVAVMQLQDARQGAMERELVAALEACLSQRLGDRADVEVATVGSAAEAKAQWGRWQRRPDIVAALAPPWRGWRPEAPHTGADALPALFPLVADPDPGAREDVHWLFGGVEARTVALVQAWLQSRPDGPATLPVWPGQGAFDMMERVTGVVLRDTGRPVAWQVLDAPQLKPGDAGLWLDGQQVPPEGWWLLPRGAASRPALPGRWWVAAPFAGQPARSLAQRWADATCRTADAVLDDLQGNARRDRWPLAVARSARLRDGNGWEWHVPAQDAQGYGASTAWTIVELSTQAPPTPVAPQVNIGRPAEGAR